MTSGPRRPTEPPPPPRRRPNDPLDPIELRVARAAESALAERGYVSAIDILVALGWLPPSRVDAWRQGRIPDLESRMSAPPGKISTAMTSLERWATGRGLLPSETDYVARTLDRRALRFSVSGSPAIERAYRTDEHRSRSILPA